MPVKVRLFDIGGIGEPRTHAILAGNLNVSVQSPKTSSIHFDQPRCSQSRLSQQE